VAGAAGRWAWGSRLLGNLRDSENASLNYDPAQSSQPSQSHPPASYRYWRTFGSTHRIDPYLRFTTAYRFRVLRWKGESFSGSRRGLLSLTVLNIFIIAQFQHADQNVLSPRNERVNLFSQG